MSTTRLLPGETPVHDAEVVDETTAATLHREIANCYDKLDDLEAEFQAHQKQVSMLLTGLRQLLNTGIVGGGGVPSSPTTSAADFADRWAKVKNKFGGKLAEVIDALQVHGPLTRSQLRVTTGSGMSTIDQVTAKLRDMGLIVKQGDAWSLKG